MCHQKMSSALQDYVDGPAIGGEGLLRRPLDSGTKCRQTAKEPLELQSSTMEYIFG